MTTTLLERPLEPAPASLPQMQLSPSRRQPVLRRLLGRLTRPDPAPDVPWRQVAQALGAADAVLARGWVQDAWFHVRQRSGRVRAVGPLELHLLQTGPVVGACLVGSVVEAVGGHGQARSAVTARTLDTLWDALQQHLGQPATARGGAPAERVRELARWNDASGRTGPQVRALVASARASALSRC